MRCWLVAVLVMGALLGRVKGDAACTSSGGTCKYTNYRCAGTYVRGKCSGAWNRQCCIPSGDLPCMNSGGKCQYTSYSCAGNYVSGKCSGPWNRKCCIQAPGGTGRYTHAQALNPLSAAGITVSSSGSCSNRYNRRCTSLDNVRRRNIHDLIWLKNASRCTIRLTGGTETGHAGGTYSHWNGYKLDIARLSCVNTYITRNFPYIGNRSDGARTYRDSKGNKYYLEGNHWDILYA